MFKLEQDLGEVRLPKVVFSRKRLVGLRGFFFSVNFFFGIFDSWSARAWYGMAWAGVRKGKLVDGEKQQEREDRVYK